MSVRSVVRPAARVASSSPLASRRLLAAVLAVAAVSAVGSLASAGVSTWTANASGSWSDSANWDVVPNPNDSLNFAGNGPFTGSVIVANNDLAAGTTFGLFTQDTATTGTYANGRVAISFGGPQQFNLTGNAIKVVGDITNTSGLLQTVSLNFTGQDVQGTNGRTFGVGFNAGTGGLTINGNFGLDNTSGIAPNVNGFVDFNATGSGAITLNGTNTVAAYLPSAGTNVVINGVTTMKFFGTIGGNTTINNGGALNFTAATGSDVRVNGNLTINSGGKFETKQYFANAANVTLTHTVSGTGQLLAGTDLNIGDLGGSTVTLNVSDTATIKSATSYIGRSGNGIVNMSGGTWNATGYRIGTDNAATGVVNLSGGSITGTSFVSLGANGTTRGRLNISGGSFTATNQDFNVSDNNNTRGTLTVSGGTLTAGAYFIGKGTSTAATAVGLATVSGGTVTNTSNVQVGAWGTGMLTMTGGVWNNSGGSPSVGRQASGFGVLDISGSGIFNQNGAANRMIVGENGIGVLNVRNGGTLNVNSTTNAGTAGSLDSDNAALTIGNADLTTDVGIVNLLAGGTINTRSVGSVNGVNSSSTLNLNGGTLKVSSARTTAGSFIASNVDNVYVWSGGAVIDTNNIATAINRPLVAPTGAGVAGINAVAGGFTAAPVVKISGGGGSGATALAQLDGSGNVSGFTITNPGVGYTSAPTVTLVGFDGTTTSTAATLNTGNTSGGLTKLGLGVLMLGASNTYTGGTTVTAGTLALAAGGSIDVSSGVNINSGASFDVSAKSSGYSFSGKVSGGGSVNGLLIASNVQPGNSIGDLSFTDLTLTGTYTAEYSGSNADRLLVSGTLDITAGSLNFVQLSSTGFQYPAVIATYGTLVGTSFASQTLPSGLSVDYHFGGQNVIAVVPEPATLSAIAGVALLGLRRRRA